MKLKAHSVALEHGMFHSIPDCDNLSLFNSEKYFTDNISLINMIINIIKVISDMFLGDKRDMLLCNTANSLLGLFIGYERWDY